MDIRETDSEYVAATYSRFPLTVTGGQGSVLVGDDGRKYIDLGTGIAVNTFGMCDGEWVEAVKKQLDTCGHTSNLYYTEPCAVLAKMLCERTGMKKVFFSNSGAEANECAIKAARRFAFRKYGDESRSTVITLKSSFHGRTVTTLAATGQDAFHTEFGPFTGGFVYAEAGDLDGLEALCKQGCCAVMFECVQGEGGVNALDADFVHGIFGLCEKYGILTIADEVQCGNGRSGKLYAYMNYGVTPDIVTNAKGLAGGLPLGATMFGERAADIYTPGSHGSTFGGNPICAAGAVNVLSRIDDDLLAGVVRRSEIIRSYLAGKPGIVSISGMGLMLGIETVKSAADVITYCREHGVLVLSAKNRVRLLPALNIPEDLLLRALEVIAASAAE